MPVFVLLCGVSWIIEQGNFLCAGYTSTRGYASKLMDVFWRCFEKDFAGLCLSWYTYANEAAVAG